MIQLETIEQLQDFLAENPNSIIFKHSTSCPISARAYREFSVFTKNSPVQAAIVFVIESRPVSDYLAEITNLAHQSPQALFFREGKCYNNFSHNDITVENIQAAL